MNVYVKSGLVFIASVVMVLVVVILWLIRPLPSPSISEDDLSEEHLIAHAGGEINGKVYTNSKEL